MAYKRKTYDAYIVEEFVPGVGWEFVCEEESRLDARKQAKCYIENGYMARSRTVRVRIGEEYHR